MSAAERVPLLQAPPPPALPAAQSAANLPSGQSEEELLVYDEVHPDISAVSRVAASVGSCSVQFFPWVLFAVSACEKTFFSASCLLLFLWVMLQPKSLPTPTSTSVPCRIFPPKYVTVVASLVAICSIILIVVFESLCALKPQATQDSMVVLWRMFGLLKCASDDENPSKVAFGSLWAPLVVLLLSVTSFFFLRLVDSAGKEKRHDSFGVVQSVHDVDVWPKFLSPFFIFQFLMIRVFTVEWSVAICAALVGCYRRCLLSVPLLLFFVYCTFVGALRQNLYHFGRRKRPLILTAGFYFVAFVYVSAICIVHVAWRLYDESQSSIDTSRFRVLISGYNQIILDNVAHYLLLGLLISVLGIARVIAQASTQAHCTTDEVDYSDDGSGAHQVSTEMEYELLLWLRMQLFRAHIVLNPVFLFVTLNVGASLLGIVWVCLWVLYIVVKAKEFVVKAIVCWGVMNLLLLFLGGFEFISATEERWRTIGMKFGGTTDTIVTATIMLTAFYNCFVLSSMAGRSNHTTLDRAADAMALAAADTGEANDSLRTEELDAEEQTDAEKLPSRPRRQTLTEFAVRRVTSVQYAVIKYFYIFAFFGLFLAAVVRVNALHAVFLVLFAIIVAWRPVPQMLWGLLVAYTLLLTMAIYCVHVAARAETSSFLVTLGFLARSRSSWASWPYFVWSCVFVVQFHVFRSRIQDQSFRWTQYIPVVERLLASFICIVNCALFAVVASTQRASIFGFFYLIFFVITTTVVMLTSLHSPGRIVRLYWRMVVMLLVLMVTSVYLYTLFAPSVKDFVNRELAHIGLSPQILGILIEGRLGLWPSISSLLLCIVQSRVWNPTITDIVGDSAETLEQLRIFIVVRHLAARTVTLLELYSLTIAAMFLMIASLTCLCVFDQIAVVNLTYFMLGCLVSVSKAVRSSVMFWVALQMFSSGLCLVQYVAQFPMWNTFESMNDWQVYIGVSLMSNSKEMYNSLSPSLFVFSATAIHVYIRSQVSPEDVEETIRTHRVVPSGSAPSGAVEDLLNRPLTDSLYFILSHPMRYFDIAGYHVALLALFVGAVLHIRTVLGPVYLFLALAVGFTGRQGIRKFLRWTTLCIFLFAMMVMQYALLLGLPPGITIKMNISEVYQEYLALQPSKVSAAIAMTVWIIANLERISLSRRIPLFHWFWGLPCGHFVAAPLTMTERQCRFQWRIAGARKHNARELLLRTIPLPRGNDDFTDDAHQLTGGKVKHKFYLHAPMVVLLVAFVHAVYDAGSRLVLTKLASLFLCLLFLQSLRELPWHGNQWWRWLLRFHVVWLCLRMLYNVPVLQKVEAVSCSLRYLGLEPTGQILFDAAGTTWSCSGSSFTVSELSFHAVVICLLWVQWANFDRAEYAFVLHRQFLNDLESQSLGEKIRAERLKIIQKVKDYNVQNIRKRQQLLEKVWVAHHRDGAPAAAITSPIAPRSQEALFPPSPTPADDRRGNLQATITTTNLADTTNAAATNLDDTSIEVLAGTYASMSVEPLAEKSPFRLPEVPKAAPYRSGDMAHSFVLDSASPRPRPAPDDAEAQTLLRSFLARWYELVDGIILWLDRNSINHPAQRVRNISGHRLVTFTMCIYRWLFSYTDRVSYFVFGVQFAISPNLLSCILPVSSVVYAAAMNPRPHRGYWSLCKIYLIFNMLVISMIKVLYCSAASEADTSSETSIALFGRACASNHYIVDMILKLACLMCVTLHTDHLHRWGLWIDSELDTSAASTEGSAGSVLVAKIADAARNISRDECKTGDDLYKVSLSFELVSFIFIFFAYYQLVGLDDTLVESLKHSILPGSLAVTLIVLFAFMVIDRIVYLHRSLLTKYIINVVFACTYHAMMIYWFASRSRNANGQLASFWLNGVLPLAVILYFFKACYLNLSSTQVQRGYYEYTTHIVFSGTFSQQEYIVYYAGRLMPFLFELRVILDWTVTKTTLKLSYFMKLEDLCHELYLLRADQEDTRITDEVKGNNHDLPYPVRYKYPLGGVAFVLLASLLMFPLLLYSSFSPVVQTNSVSMLSASLSLEGFPPLWDSSNQFASRSSVNGGSIPSPLNQTVVGLMQRLRPSLGGLDFRTSTIQLLTTNNYSSNTWSISPPARERMLNVLSGNDTLSFLLDVSIRNSAVLAGPATSVLRQMKSIDDEVRRKFTELLRGEVASIVVPSLYTPFLFNKPQNDFTSLATASDGRNTVDCFLATSSQGDINETLFFSTWCHTLFARSNPQGDNEWGNLSPAEWSCLESSNCPNYESINQSSFGTSSAYFVVSSTPVLSATLLQSIGIVAAYTTFVFAFGRVVRFAVAGDAYRMSLQDLEDPTYLANLIEYIFIARAQANFTLEREVYLHLVDTIRVTERLERETRRRFE